MGNGCLFQPLHEIFAIDETGKEQQMTFTNKNIYDSIKFGEVKERWVKTTDGKQMLVWLIFPPDFDSTKKYPALLFAKVARNMPLASFFHTVGTCK